MSAPQNSDRDGETVLPEALVALSAAVRRGAATDLAHRAGARDAPHPPAAAEAPSPTGPTRRRPTRRLGLLAVLGVLVTGSAVAATGPWRPQLGDDHRGRPRVATTTAPAAQLRALGVLRRPQADADRSAPVRRALRLLAAREDVGVRVDGVRLLAATPTAASVLVPLERSGTHDPGYPDSTVTDALCVVRVFPGGGGGEVCRSTADLRTGRLRTAAWGLVPDGVARVEVTTRTGRVLGAPVRDNFYALPLDLDGTMRSDDPDFAAEMAAFRSVLGRPVRWYGPDGHRVVKPKRR